MAGILAIGEGQILTLRVCGSAPSMAVRRDLRRVLPRFFTVIWIRIGNSARQAVGGGDCGLHMLARVFAKEKGVPIAQSTAIALRLSPLLGSAMGSCMPEGGKSFCESMQCSPSPAL